MDTAGSARAVTDLTAALVGIDSVSTSLVPGAPGEAEIARVLATRLDAAGYDVRLLPAPSDPRRVSLIATRSGSRPGRTVVFNGHLDTVGVEGMADPFTARIEGDRLIGRGTSDMKGGVAGLVVAAEQLAADDVPGTVVVALVADEEDGSVGATTVLDDLRVRGEKPDLCLIAEPTWLRPASAHRGYAVVDVHLHGRAAHSSQAELGIDALRAMGELLTAIARYDEELRSRAPHPELARGSMMATVAHAGTATFTVAAEAEVCVERRTLPGEHPAQVVDEVRALVDSVVAAHPGLRAEVGLALARDAWQADAAGPAAEFSALLTGALQRDTVEAPFGAPYWMESALWQEAGVPTVVCGPAGGGLHAIDEWVDLAQLQRFPVAVAEATARFLAASA